MAARLQAMHVQKYAGTTRRSGRQAVWTGRVNFDDAALDAPLRWRKPLRIFVNSMSDLFQDPVPVSFIHRVWNVMEKANWHSVQILTKRPKRMCDVLSDGVLPKLKNVWLGTSVENQESIDRINMLRQTPAYIRFVSFEPLLSPINDVDLADVHWAIVGGESGPGARPMEAWWAEELCDSCRKQGVAFFFKQWVAFGKAGQVEHLRAALGMSTPLCQQDYRAGVDQSFAFEAHEPLIDDFEQIVMMAKMCRYSVSPSHVRSLGSYTEHFF